MRGNQSLDNFRLDTFSGGAYRGRCVVHEVDAVYFVLLFAGWVGGLCGFVSGRCRGSIGISGDRQ